MVDHLSMYITLDELELHLKKWQEDHAKVCAIITSQNQGNHFSISGYLESIRPLLIRHEESGQSDFARVDLTGMKGGTYYHLGDLPELMRVFGEVHPFVRDVPIVGLMLSDGNMLVLGNISPE